MLLDEAMRVLNLERGPTVNLSLRRNEPHRPRFRGIVPVGRTDAHERSVRFDHLLARTTSPRRSLSRHSGRVGHSAAEVPLAGDAVELEVQRLGAAIIQCGAARASRSEEHKSELQSLMRNSY